MRVIFNGSLIDEKEASLPVSDKAVWFDFGVYESIKVINGTPFYPDKHIGRFFNSAHLIGMEMGFSESDILSWITTLIKNENLNNSLLRLAAYGDTQQNKKSRIYVFPLGLTFYPNSFYTEGASAITFNGERFLSQSKSFNLLVNYMAYKKAEEVKAIEALLINKDGYVTEGTRSNLFIITKNQVISPPIEDILSGVTRDLLLNYAKAKGTSIREEKISKERLLGAEEVFITSTSMNVMPIVQINNYKIANGKVGETTRELHLLFREMHRNYFRKKL
jgi:D-amino acid aminotransferase